MENFDYVIEKIATTPLSEEPFKHLYIADFFSDEHFSQIISSPEVNIIPTESDEELLQALYAQNFKEITFPGTTTDIPHYLAWHKSRAVSRMTDVNCEGFGVTLRLQQTKPGTILDDVAKFYKSQRFWEALADRFQIDLSDVTTDIGLQKYLDGYEISPHPDIRKKALTFMINVNPSPFSETLDIHTRYLKLKPEFQHVLKYWEENPKVDRCWVPWSSCDVYKQQPKNNSMVIFSPANDTLHAVKAAYDHLATQRTQFYGNLWNKTSSATSLPRWDELCKQLETQAAL